MPHPTLPETRWPEHLLRECSLMSAFALREGLAVSPYTVARVEAAVNAAAAGREPSVSGLVELHAELCRVVAPVTPEGLEASMPPPGAAPGTTAPLLRRLIAISHASQAGLLAHSH
jgi:hypothetical protein